MSLSIKPFKIHNNEFLRSINQPITQSLRPSLTSSYIMIYLNSPDIISGDFLKKLWNYCEIVICADGGANRLHEQTIGFENKELYIPNYITGDLDSLKPDIHEYYRYISKFVNFKLFIFIFLDQKGQK